MMELNNKIESLIKDSISHIEYDVNMFHRFVDSLTLKIIGTTLWIFHLQMQKERTSTNPTERPKMVTIGMVRFVDIPYAMSSMANYRV